MDLALCTCKKIESEGIPCRKILAYLLKVQEVDYLPQEYILKRWTKVVKTTQVKDLDGLEITDTNALVVKRSKLFHHASLVIDKVLTSSDKTHTVFIEALNNALDKLKQMKVNNSATTRIGKTLECDVHPLEHRYNEPNKVRAKGCGKRNKKTKETAKKRRCNASSSTNSGRKCRECGLYGQKHDKQNCLALEKPEHSSMDKDSNQFSSFEEDEEPISANEDEKSISTSENEESGSSSEENDI